MTPRKRLEGALAEWHPHPKETPSSLPPPAPPTPSAPPADPAIDELDRAVAQPSPSRAAPSSLTPVVRDTEVVPNNEEEEEDELADRFFSDPPDEGPETVEDSTGAFHATRADTDDEVVKRRIAQDSPAVRARRQYLMRHVVLAVGVCGLIGLGGLVRMMVSHEALASNDAAHAATPPKAAALPPAQPEAPPAPPPVQAPAPADSSGGDFESNTQAAEEAKKDSLRALEEKRFSDAVEAGERSVALDPSDADAWRILGAAYQRRGLWTEARRCFATCTHVATRGDRWECGALLH